MMSMFVPKEASSAAISKDFLSLLFAQANLHWLLHARSDQQSICSGRVRSAYYISGLNAFWNVDNVTSALLMHQDACNSLDTLMLFEALVLGHDSLSERPDFWLSALKQLKKVVVDGATNPANLRGVKDADLATCAEAAHSIATKFFVDLSGEDLTGVTAMRELQDRAVEWIQHTM